MIVHGDVFENPTDLDNFDGASTWVHSDKTPVDIQYGGFEEWKDKSPLTNPKA